MVPYADKPGLPVTVRDAIMPIFQELSKAELLEKYLHGKAQNCNEAQNDFIWKRLLEDVFVGPYVLELSGYYTRQFCLVSSKDGNKDVNTR